jgi:hypothetical protein
LLPGVCFGFPVFWLLREQTWAYRPVTAENQLLAKWSGPPIMNMAPTKEHTAHTPTSTEIPAKVLMVSLEITSLAVSFSLQEAAVLVCTVSFVFMAKIPSPSQ